MTAESEGRVRLTKAQREFLAECGRHLSVYAVASYLPAVKLEALGLVEVAQYGRWDGRYYAITESGRRALETSHDK